MLEDPLPTFVIGAACSIVSWSLVLRLLVWPRLRELPRERALLPLVLVECFRHVSLVVLLPGFAPDVPTEWSHHTVAGDLLTVVLAWVAVAALSLRARWALPAVWLMNVVGLVDLLRNVVRAAAMDIVGDMGPAIVVPMVGVPLMALVHVVIFAVLLRRDERAS